MRAWLHTQAYLVKWPELWREFAHTKSLQKKQQYGENLQQPKKQRAWINAVQNKKTNWAHTSL